MSRGVLLAADVIEFAVLRSLNCSLSNDNENGNKNGEKALGFKLF